MVRRVTLALAVALAAALAAGALASGAARFDPASVTFVSLDRGWALGNDDCGHHGAPLELMETADGGRSWSPRPLPAALVAAAGYRVAGSIGDSSVCPGLDVRFADPSDGWIYGEVAAYSRHSFDHYTTEPVLWSTHDGAASWHQQPLHGLGELNTIFDLEAAAGTAHLLESDSGLGLTIKSSPVSSDDWRTSTSARLGIPAGGSEITGSIVLQGSTGWVVEGNDRGTTGSARLAGGRWVAWTPPCADVGHTFAVPAATNPQDLAAICAMGGFAYPLSKSAPPGAKLGSVWLYRSTDGGASFVAGPELSRGFAGAENFNPTLVAAPTASAILTGGDQELIASFDGGRHWQVVYHRGVAFLGFTSPSQGVAITTPTTGGATTMLMSRDGGRHWAPVAF